MTDIRDETRTVFSLMLAARDGSGLPGWRAGQFITLRLRPEGDDPPLIRNYSLSNEPGSDTFRISIKREPYGAASGYIRAHIDVGDSLEVAAPHGTFFLGDGDAPVVLLSAGVGATPVLSMLHFLVQQRSEREVWWLHGARDRSEHAFAEESRTLLTQLRNGHWHVAYSRPAQSDRAGLDYTTRGRLSIGLLRDLEITQDVDAYLCGPAAFMAELAAGLVEYGLAPNRIHTETFGAEGAITPGIALAPTKPSHQPAGPPGHGPQVSFARSGIAAPFGSRYGSLLDFAEQCDVPTRWSCRTGVCHTCETPLLAGAVHYDPEPLEPPAPGNVLICCSQPTADVVLDL